MLEIFNNLKPFFEDNYRRINVREYARIAKISPPSASKLLEKYNSEGLLKKEKERNYIFYSANRESRAFIGFSRIYWGMNFEQIGLISYFEKEYIAPLIILFGSISKAEVKDTSDIDVALFSITKKDSDLSLFEKKLNRKIQLFAFKSSEEVKNKYLLKNIQNGHILSGSW